MTVRVLLIEDNDVDAAVFQRYVTAMSGWRVDRVGSLDAADEQLDAVGPGTYDVVAVDLTLPDAMDLESIAYARANLPHAACVAVTARDPAEVDDRALRAGAADLLVKAQMNARGVQRALHHAVERNQLVRRQLESERNLRSLLGAWSDALFVVADDGTVLFRNDAAASFADALTDPVGGKLTLAIDPGDVVQVDLPRPVGDPLPVELRSWRMPWADRPARVVVLRDRVTERATERTRARIEEAERRAHVGEGALAGVHDIGNRVTAMLGTLHEAQQALDSSDPSRETVLRDSMHRLDQSLQHVAEVVRTSRRAVTDGRTLTVPLDVGAVVRTCCDALRPAIEASARLRLQLEPATDVLGDPVALGRVIDNLLANATQAIGTGAPDRNEIRVSVRQDADLVVVEVQDTGPGIPDGVLDRLFERHFTTKATGTGIGLATVKEVVRAHGGTVDVRSTPGQGACFTVRLPAVRHRATSIRVLMVEDRPEVARANQRILGARYEVDLAEDGREALAKLAGGADYAVILCDLDMPGMDGRTFYERLGEEHAALTRRVVFCSGGATTEDLDRFLATSARPCLPKPLDVREAIAVIDAVAAS